MTAKEKAEELVVFFKNMLMDEDTDCGNEILCTKIALKSSHALVMEVLDELVKVSDDIIRTRFWLDVRNELLKL